MALTKIVKNGITADAVDATKIADDAISEEHLDVTAITGNAELSAQADDNDVLLVFDTSAGTIKKIQKSNVALAVPTFTSVSPTSLLTGDGTGNHTIVVTGTKFDASATFKIRTDGGTDIDMDSVTRNSATQLTGVVAKSTSGITNANEPFDIVITNGSGLTTVATNQLNVDAQPVYVTAAGTLGTVSGGSAISTIDIVAADPESTGNVTFEFQSGSLPGGLSSTTVNENGVSKFRITGTPTNPTANTTTNFVLRAADAASNVTSRAFSITVNRTFTSTSFTSSGTFAVPSGTTSLSQVLVVAGGGGGGDRHAGGGGGGGLVFMPCYPVTPGGTITVTVGCGGGGGVAGQLSPSGRGVGGQDSVFAASPSPGKHPTGDVLTAKGGGYGTPGSTGGPGGSGGGGGHSVNSGGSATQPTQPGDSGAYGFGFAGGASIGQPGIQGGAGAGGGGAGAVGGQSCAPTNIGGQGGIGKAYTIADGTSPVYYAGGGGGSDHGPSGAQAGGGGEGGQGGGADGLSVSNAAPFNGPNTGTANRGGGGGGGTRSCTANNGGAGGKGIVIVRF